MSNYIKISDPENVEIVYYVKKQCVTQFLDNKHSEFAKLWMADYVVNIKTNELLKCRHSFEYIIDNFVRNL